MSNQNLESTDSAVPGPRAPVRLAYLVTHPIQYQAPLLKRVAALPNVAFKAFFQSDFSTRAYADPGFGRAVEWDVPLLEGYAHEFLPAYGPTEPISQIKPFSHGLAGRLKAGQFDVLWVHGYAVLYNLISLISALAHGKKVLIRDEVTATSGPRKSWREWVKGILLRGLSRAGARFLAIGTPNAQYYRDLGIPAHRRALNAARGREEFRKSLGLADDAAVILYASKFSARKRPGDVLEGYKLLMQQHSGPVPYLLFAGDGELRAEVEDAARAAGLGRVIFLGFQNQTQLPMLFDLCDVFVLVSVTEPWGLVINEVMNAARPVIVSDQVGSAMDLVRDFENGFIVPAGDAAALAKSFAYVIADPQRAQAMGQRSLEIIGKWGFDQDLAGLVAALDDIQTAKTVGQ